MIYVVVEMGCLQIVCFLESNSPRQIESRQAQGAIQASNSSPALLSTCLECGEDSDRSHVSIFSMIPVVVEMWCIHGACFGIEFIGEITTEASLDGGPCFKYLRCILPGLPRLRRRFWWITIFMLLEMKRFQAWCFSESNFENSGKRCKLDTDHSARRGTGGTFSTSHIPRGSRLTVHRGLQVAKSRCSSKICAAWNRRASWIIT